MIDKLDKHKAILQKAKISFSALMMIMIMSTYLPQTVQSNEHYPGKVYYVSTTGSDSNPGTMEQPWRTIQKAADTLAAGEAVFVRGGKYEESVTITKSGSTTAGYITFQAYPNEKPIIDGSNLESSSLLHLSNAHYIVWDGFELTGLQSSSSSDYLSGIKITDGGSNIYIQNNRVHHIANLATRGNANGIIVYGNSSISMKNINIISNEVDHLVLGSSESVTVVGNVDGFRIERNIIHDNNNIGIDIAGYYNTCSNCQDQARNGVVAHNTVYNIDTSNNPAYGSGTRAAAGIYIDGGTETIVENNHVYQNNFGIEIASEKLGKNASSNIVRNNLIHHNHLAGVLLGGASSSNGGTQGNIVTNNTFFNNNTAEEGYSEIKFQYNNSNNTIVNNIVYASNHTEFIQLLNNTGSNNVVDYNLYYCDSGLNAVRWRWKDSNYNTLEEFKKATGIDIHSKFANPLFVNQVNNNYSLTSNSPAIDQGTKIYGNYGEIDYNGMVRILGESIDIGAVEYSVKDDFPTPEPTPTPTPDPSEETPIDDINIVVDGNDQDWKGIPVLSTSSSNVRQMKAVATSDTLYVLITGFLLTEKGQLYINSGQDSKTQFSVPYWSEGNADYLLEDGVFYRYNGKTGNDWNWSRVINYIGTTKFVRHATMLEMAIPLSDMSANGNQLQIGYVWKDSSSDKLPLNNRMLRPIDGEVTIPNPTPEPTPVPSVITIDGKIDDWSKIDSIASATGRNSLKSLKVANDDHYLYVLVEGSKLGGKDQVYINSDANEATGYQITKWSSAGIDYLIEDGSLYSYNGNGKNWSFIRLEKLIDNQLYSSGSTIIEMAIPLQSINISSGQEIKIGALVDDNKSAMIPEKGNMISYILQ